MNTEVVGEEDCGLVCRSSELEERSKKVDARVVELEVEVEKWRREKEGLESRFKVLEKEKNAVEDELKALRIRVYLTVGDDEEDDKMFQIMAENQVLECEKKRAESEVQVWKERCKELELQVSQLSAGAGLRDAEQPIEVKDGADHGCWKEKLVGLVDFTAASSTPGKPYDQILADKGTPNFCVKGSENEGKLARQVRKHLSFVGSPSTRMAPSTPRGDKHFGQTVINIGDSDDEDEGGIQMAVTKDQGNRNNQKTEDVSVPIGIQMAVTKDQENGNNQQTEDVSIPIDHAFGGTVYSKQSYEEDMDAWEDNIPRVSTRKRKRATSIVSSDTEGDTDDNIPICKLKGMHFQESIANKANPDVKSSSNTIAPISTPSRRRLVKQIAIERKVMAERRISRRIHETKYQQGSESEDLEDSESENVGSDSEGDSFIVKTSDESDGDNAAGEIDDKVETNDAYGETDDEVSQLEDISDGDGDYSQSKDRSDPSRDHKYKWELEGDMLAAFAKNPELCMKAVCAINRRDVYDERFNKATLCCDGRGFSRYDATRGSTLAYFLTAGNPMGEVKKSVQQLQEHDPNGVETCDRLAYKYSKQLFDIYLSNEDPFFP